MKYDQFIRLKAFDDFSEVDCDPGEYFLAGEKMVEQRLNKEPGEEVTVYMMLNKIGDSINYMPKIFRLKE